MRNIISFVSQEAFLYNNTIRENILFGINDKCSDAELIEAAKQSDAHDFIMNTENGYDTIVGEGGGKLSVGQKQRIAIARAMLRKPQILILDEPTSALDKESSRRVIETLQKLKRDLILILVTHKIDSVINADMIFTMKDGKIIETGDHKALMANKNEYYRLFNL